MDCAASLQDGAAPRLGSVPYHRDGKNVGAARFQDSMNFGKTGRKIRDVLQGFGGDDEIEAGRGVGQPGQIFRGDFRTLGAELGKTQPGEAGEEWVQISRGIDLRDGEILDTRVAKSGGQRRRAHAGAGDQFGEDCLRELYAAQIGAAVQASAAFPQVEPVLPS